MKSEKWTHDEISTLKEHYLTSTNEELCALFPNRTYTSIYRKAYKIGLRKSEEIEFKNRSNARKGSKSSSWKGGRKLNKKGYVLIHYPEHDRADWHGYVLEHIVVWEKHTGVKVPDNCAIHHLNENKADNRISNLCLMEKGAHTAFHNSHRTQSQETKEKISISRRKTNA